MYWHICFIGHNFGDYKNCSLELLIRQFVLSVTILETTKTCSITQLWTKLFYRSQFWRLQKPPPPAEALSISFIGHNFGDYKNCTSLRNFQPVVLSVTILETTKTTKPYLPCIFWFYRSQFWRLQKPQDEMFFLHSCFIGHNFVDYKNLKWYQLITP